MYCSCSDEPLTHEEFMALQATIIAETVPTCRFCGEQHGKETLCLEMATAIINGEI